MVKRLKSMRESLGLSQAGLAEIIGITQQAINKYENSSTEPDIENLTKLAEFFDTSIDYLVGATDVAPGEEDTGDYQFSSKELKVMEKYKTLSDDNQKLINKTLDALQNK